MPEFVPPKPPEIKHEVNVEDFIKAVMKVNNDEIFEKKEWFYIKSGIEIIEDETFKNLPKTLIDELKRTRNYGLKFIVLKESRCILTPGTETILLDDLDTGLIKTTFIFYKCILPGINLQRSKTGKWIFSQTHINNDIVIEGNSKCGDIWIDYYTKSEKITIYESQAGNILVNNNSQSGDIDIDNYSRSMDIRVCDNSQSGHIRINNNSQSDEIRIKNNSKSVDIRINLSSLNGDFVVEENSSCNEIAIEDNSQGISQGGNIQIENSRINQISLNNNCGSVILYNAVVPLMRFNKCSLHQLILQAGTKGELYINNSSINHINLSGTSLLKDAVVSISNSKINVIQLEELLVQGQLMFRNIQFEEESYKWDQKINKNFDEMEFIDAATPMEEEFADAITPEEKESLIERRKLLAKQHIELLTRQRIELLTKKENVYNASVQQLRSFFPKRPLLLIANSSLGKTEITGCELYDIHFEYLNSKILDCFITGTKLPKDKIEIYNPNPLKQLPEKVKYEQESAIYNQLKKIFENQGDVVEATWYHSKAMENQERLLKLHYKEIKAGGFKKWFGEERFNLFNFWVNKKSNNHGESWRRALRFIFLSSLVAYSLYYLFLHCREPFSFNATDRFVGDYFVFLNPTHGIDFHVAKENLWWLPKIFDFLGRIVIGYGIYQLIAAFRRHGRRIA